MSLKLAPGPFWKMQLCIFQCLSNTRGHRLNHSTRVARPVLISDPVQVVIKSGDSAEEGETSLRGGESRLPLPALHPVGLCVSLNPSRDAFYGSVF